MDIIDLRNFDITPSLLGGTHKKYTVVIDGSEFIIKYPKRNKNGVYDYSVYSEYIASHILAAMNIDVHEVAFGRTKDGTLVNVIKNFVYGTNLVLKEFGDTHASSVDSSTVLQNSYSYSDVIAVINAHKNFVSTDSVLYRFWLMFVWDAILGNRDRNPSNWGFIQDPVLLQYTFAPLYDNGGCLFPEFKDFRKEYFSTEAQIKYHQVKHATLYRPASQFHQDKKNESRSNFYLMLEDLSYSKYLHDIVLTYRQRLPWQYLAGVCQRIIYSTDAPADYKQFMLEIIVLKYRTLILREDFDVVYSDLINGRLY